MNQEQIALKEIEFIIDNDRMSSTYKMALYKGAIEISYNHTKKAILSSDSKKIIFPLSYITAYFIRYYYPLFASGLFIPQLTIESQKNRPSSSQSAFRKDFSLIIEYYSNNGGFLKLWEHMQKDTIPPGINGVWNTLCSKITTTIVNQPMKYFGNKNSQQMYTVFQPVPDCSPENYVEEFPGCSVNNSFFSYSVEYHNLFSKPLCSKRLIEKVHQRWCSFTMNLVDDTSGISSKLVMDILRNATNSQTETQSEKNIPVVSERPPLYIIPLIQNSLSKEKTDIACDILSYSAESVVNSLHETINESHANMIAVKSGWVEAEKELFQLNSDIAISNAAIQKITNQYGIVTEPVPAAIAALEDKKSSVKNELNSDEQTTRQERNDLIRQIEALKSDKKELGYLHDMISYDNAEFTKKKAEVLELNREFVSLENKLRGRTPSFGYVGMPIKRFLTHCDDIASDFLLQSIHLYLAKTDPYLDTSTELPEWFVSAFEGWWKEKTAIIQRERRSSGTVSHNPVLFFDSNHREITLLIPPQHVQSKHPIDEVDIIVHTSSEVIYEESHPLYHESEGYTSDEILLPLTVPSDVYHVEIVTKDSSKRFQPIEIFTPLRKYACFDYESGRMLSGNGNIIEKSAYVLFSEPISVTPKSAIVESGRFYGPWQGYSYYFIEPQYSGSDSVTVGPVGETADSNNQAYPSVALEHYHMLEDIRVNGKTTLTGLPPTVLLTLPSPEDISDYRLSIHPLSTGTITETRLYTYDDFKEHCSFIERGTVCRFDLSSDHYLGIHPVGTFAVRIRCPKKRFDHIFEFSIIPNLSVSFSKQLYLPKKGNGVVVLNLNGPSQLQCKADEPFVAVKKKDAWIISGPVMPEVQGTMNFPIPGGAEFSDTFSLPIHHLSWRFENPEKGIIGPIQREIITVSDDTYDELGDGKKVTLFLPEEYSGTGTITVTPGESYIMKEIKQGKAIFPLSRFNDALRETKASNYSFAFSFESNKEHFETKLFDLDIWEISRFSWKIKTDDQKRDITFSWQEKGNVPVRKLIIWKAGQREGTPQKMAELMIPAKARSLTISDARTKVSPGIYYAQFIRIRDEWSSTPVLFPGEHTPNFFQFSVELEGTDLLKEGDDLFAAGQYVDAIERFKELERLNPQLGELWKQKIQNTFIYTFRYDEVLNLFTDLIKSTHLLKSIDYSYVTFRVFECLKRPDKITYETFIRLFVVLELILDKKDETSWTIITSKVGEIEIAVKLCPVIGCEQYIHVRKMVNWVKSLPSEKKEKEAELNRRKEAERKKRKENLKGKTEYKKKKRRRL